MLRWISALLVLAIASPLRGARAEAPATYDGRMQLQADLGLATVAIAFEVPVASRVAVQLEAGVFSTYFLPWFGRGDELVGGGGGVRVTWFSKPGSRGYYFAPFLRVDQVSGEVGGVEDSGLGYSAGFFLGRTFRIARKVDGRVGAGLQYFDYSAGALEAKTPFIAIDAVIGYRL